MLRKLLFVLILSAGTAAAVEAPAPFSGVWWDPARSGNGVSLTFLPDGTWFAVVYGHDDAGEPLFLTAQGVPRRLPVGVLIPDTPPHIAEYPDPPYGEISGALLETRNGPCIGCISGAPVTTPSHYGELTIHFTSVDRAELSVAGTNWELEPLTPTPAHSFDRARFENGRLYAVTVSNADDEATVLARGVPGRGNYIGFHVPFSLECLTCDAIEDPAEAERIRRMVEGLEGFCPMVETSHCVLLLHDQGPGGISSAEPGVQYQRYPTVDGGMVGQLVGEVGRVPWSAARFEARLLDSGEN
jgi:hypothetical protein